VATDTSGNRGVAPVSTSVLVVADQPPAVAITSPADISARNGDRIVVNVHATDDLSLKEIGYRALTGKPGDASTTASPAGAMDRTESFAFHVPADAEPGTVIDIQASASDSKGQVSAAAPVHVTVLDSVLPVVTITGATTGAQVRPGQQTTVVVTATDKGAISSITFSASGVVTTTSTRAVDPAQKSAVTSFTVTVPQTAQPGQSLLLDATAVDRARNVGTAARVILPIADSKPPVLTLAPESGVPTAVPGRLVRVVANATDETGITRIDLTASGAVTFSDGRQVFTASNEDRAPQ